MVLYDNPTFKLRVIPFENRSGKENMALDHYLANLCSENSQPIIRFYGWSPCCLSIGYHQNKELIDYAALNNAGYDWVRRPTGGRAIFHSDELTYSVVFPKTLFQPQALYLYIHNILRLALNTLGYPVELKIGKSKIPKITNNSGEIACFTRSAYSEIHYNNKKVVGSAQRVFQRVILQHGSILIGQTHKRIVEFLRAKQEVKKKMEREFKSKTNCLSEIKNMSITPATIAGSIIEILLSCKNIKCYYKTINHNELNQARLFVTRQIERPTPFHKAEIELQ